LIEQVKLGFAETAKSFVLDMWLARQTPEKVLPILHKVLDTAKDEYADAIANGGGIYAAGYCFGAKYVVLLAGELPDNVAWGQTPKDEEHGVVNKGPFIKAGALAHGKHDPAPVLQSYDLTLMISDIGYEGGPCRRHVSRNNGLCW
jgi:dienelactone hydrolase